jgi:O-antigen/teichoic acid export membrane protein
MAAATWERILTAESSSNSPRPPDDLRHTVLKGGRLLLIRQAAGLLVSVGGVLALTRLIGPSSYGVYAAAFGIMFVGQAMGELSLDVFLVRHAGELPLRLCHQVFTVLVVLGAITTAVLFSLAPILASLLDLPRFTGVALALFASIPVIHLQQVPLSRLERQLDYRSIGLIEVSTQLAFFAVALPSAALGAGVWAPVAGWWTQQLILLFGFWSRDTYRPRLVWDAREVREILAYGIVATSSTFAYSLRNLVNPLLVGAVAGAAAVGYVSLAIRLVEQLGFAKQVMTRLSIAVLARIVDDRDRLRRALTQGTELQLLTVGLPLTGFSLLASMLIPILFGEEWRRVATLVPLLTPAYLAAAAFNLHLAVMMTRARPWDVVLSQGGSSALLWGAAAYFLPRYGVNGYAYGELVAAASWLLTDRLMARRFPRPEYTVSAGWWAALSATALAPVVSWWLVLALPACLLMPRSVSELRSVASLLVPRSAREGAAT